MKIHTRVETSHPTPAVFVQTKHTEWTPAPASGVPLRSTWRDPIGKPLTNRAIMQRALEGWYGPEWKNRALAKQGKRTVTRSGMAIPCVACGNVERVVYRRFAYLPSPGHYCPACIAFHQSQRDKEKNAHARWRELFLKEFV